MSHSIDGDYVLSHGFAEAIEEDLLRLQRSGFFQTRFTREGILPELPDATTVMIVRSVQEALQNIIKHSHASLITIHIHSTATQLTIDVRDDGKGFDPATVAQHSGLQHMKKRVSLVGGKLDIHSDVHNGTLVQIVFPLSERKYAHQPSPNR